MRNIAIALTLAAIIMITYSCRKKNNPNTAGKGGSANLSLIPQHHGRSKNFTYMTLYIKYNTKDAPSDGTYDDSVTCSVADTLWTGSFNGLKDGDYYAYGYGYDSSVKQNVKGGAPYTISGQQSITAYLPVSEN